jgi:homoserine kinase
MTFVAAAPASTANLGPGFDSLGLALDLWNELHVTPGSGRVTLEGQGADALPADERNVVVAAFERAAPGARSSVDLHCVNRVPLARGLGSSTAAVACGLVAGWHHAGEGWDAERLFMTLAELDGHPDNAAPCAFGGLTAAGPGGLVVQIPVPDWLSTVLVVPDRYVETQAARAALPETYPKHVVARAIGSAAVLAGSLATGHREQFCAALLADEIHEAQRSHLIPELARVREAISGSAAYGATISGAGPSIAVWCPPDERGTVASLLDERGAGAVLALDIAAARGACVRGI